MHLDRHVLSGVLLLCGVALPTSTQAEQPIFFLAWMQGNPGSPTGYRTDVCYSDPLDSTLGAHCRAIRTGDTFSGEASVDSDVYYIHHDLTDWVWGRYMSTHFWREEPLHTFDGGLVAHPGLYDGVTEVNDVAYSDSVAWAFFATDVGIYKHETRIREGVYISVDVDSTRNLLYAIAPGNILKLDFDGNLIELLHLDTVEPPLGLAIDEDANKISWHTDTKVKRANTSGYNSGLVTVREFSTAITDIEVFAQSNSIYVLQGNEVAWLVSRMGRGGNNYEELIFDWSPGGRHPVGFDVYEPGCRLGDGSQRLFGDVTAAWNDVNFNDIQKVAQCFQGLGSSSDRERCDLSPCIRQTSSCLGDDDVSFKDIDRVVDAFQGLGCL